MEQIGNLGNEEFVAEYNKCRQEFQMALIKTELPKVSEVINTMLNEQSIARKIFTVDELGPGQKAVYPLEDDFECPTWILPGLGYVAQDYMELMAEEVSVALFTIQAAKSWKIKYDVEKRYDVLFSALRAVAKAIRDYEEEAMWRMITPAVTSAWDGAGILPPRPAPIYMMPSQDPASGYFSKELINRMIVGSQRMGQKLTELLVSPEDLADIREWTDTDVDETTRREILKASGAGELWGITLTETSSLGILGKYNINDKSSEYGPFKGNTPLNQFNDYTVGHGNVVDQNGNLVIAGETQIYGLCEGYRDVLRMPLKPYQAHYDWTLMRKRQTGFFGWQEIGMTCLDPRRLCMGVIDRYCPSEYDYSKNINEATVPDREPGPGFVASMVELLLRRIGA